MIGYLHGVLRLRSHAYSLIDVHGVGYKVHVAQNVLDAIREGDEIELFIHTHVREDALELYGFSDAASLSLFEQLIGVSGIGPKTALGIFGLGKREAIMGAIRRADVDFFTGVARLGKKNAQKVIIELKNKLGGIEDLDLGEGESDVVTALTGFGFSLEEARKAVREIGDKGKTTTEKVKLALKFLGR